MTVMKDNIRRSRDSVRYAVATIVIHLAVSLVHGVAHTRLGIDLSAAQKIFIWLVIIAAPLAAGYLLLKDKVRAGGGLLAISMAGALAFGIFYHFIAPGTDNVNHPSLDEMASWKHLFDLSVTGIAVLEVLGTILGVRLVLKPYNAS